MVWVINIYTYIACSWWVDFGRVCGLTMLICSSIEFLNIFAVLFAGGRASDLDSLIRLNHLVEGLGIIGRCQVRKVL